MAGGRARRAVMGVLADVAAAHDGDHMPTGSPPGSPQRPARRRLYDETGAVGGPRPRWVHGT
ncbi:hypothetical protein, partial [Streptomyces sp. NPDC001759]